MTKKTAPIFLEEREHSEVEWWLINGPPNLGSYEVEPRTHRITISGEEYEQLSDRDRYVFNLGTLLSKNWDKQGLNAVFDRLEETDGIDLDRVTRILHGAWWNFIARKVARPFLLGSMYFERTGASIRKSLTKPLEKLRLFLDDFSEVDEAEANKLRSALELFSKSCERSPLLQDPFSETVLNSEEVKKFFNPGGKSKPWNDFADRELRIANVPKGEIENLLKGMGLMKEDLDPPGDKEIANILAAMRLKKDDLDE